MADKLRCELVSHDTVYDLAHALAGARRLARERPGQTLLLGLSGRGDKDIHTVATYEGITL